MPEDTFVSLFILASLFSCGLVVFITWLIRTHLGTRALMRSYPRRNSMNPALVAIIPVLWLATAAAVILALDKLNMKISENNQVLTETISTALVSGLFALITILIIRKHFSRGLIGFGLDAQIPRDFLWGPVNLIAVWPLVIGALLTTLYLGKLILGSDFSIDSHEELKLIHAYKNPSVQAAILLYGGLIIPFVEEIFFRGLIQSLIRSYIRKPWLSIIIASLIFMFVHQPTHWPAIFVLGMGMGYAYEKSGSLWRPFVMHALFNGITITAQIVIANNAP